MRIQRSASELEGKRRNSLKGEEDLGPKEKN